MFEEQTHFSYLRILLALSQNIFNSLKSCFEERILAEVCEGNIDTHYSLRSKISLIIKFELNYWHSCS